MTIETHDYIMKSHGNEPDGKLILIKNLEEFGINFPIQLYIPNELSDNPDIIVASRTPRHDSTLSFDELIESAMISGPNPIGRMLSYNLGNICLMLVIPRAVGIEAPYLGYKVYNNIFDEANEAIEKGKSNITKDDVDKFRDLHLQVEKMIQLAIDYLKSNNINVSEQVIMTGFSAEAKFSIFFSALHPNLVKGIVAGGTGGNNIIPDTSLNLTYPLGISDIPNFDYESFKQISQFYFIGDMDYNDLTKFKVHYELFPENERKDGTNIYVKDVSGNNIPRRKDGIKSYHDKIRDGKVVHIQEDIPFDKIDFDLNENGNYQLAYNGGYYTLEQVKYVVENIGHNPQLRFDKMNDYYEQLGTDSLFKRYSGDHQSVFDNQELYDDVNMFYSSMIKSKEVKR